MVRFREALESRVPGFWCRMNVAFGNRNAAMSRDRLYGESIRARFVKNVWRKECITQSFGSCKSSLSFDVKVIDRSYKARIVGMICEDIFGLALKRSVDEHFQIAKSRVAFRMF